MRPVDPQALGRRVAKRRGDAGLTQAELAAAVGMSQQGIDSIESGAVKRPRLMAELAERLKTTESWLLWGEGAEAAGAEAPAQNARMGFQDAFDALIPVYGHAIGGKDGEFPLNGNRIGDIIAPAALRRVPDAYAVYVVGDSMEPRYFSGEAVFVNPRLPVRPGDFVVAQIATGEDEPPLAYIKIFRSRGARTVKLEQLNPHKTLEFAVKTVVSLHRIIMAGLG
jgi:phage repressor protein C with HTH and peptisase S24 domain